MKADVRDIEVLRAVPPREVMAYLRARGWHEERRMDDKGAYWTHAAENAELLLPLRPGLRDFAMRMADVLDTLASIEGRSQVEVLLDMEAASSDAIRIRVSAPGTQGGSIALDSGVALVRRTWDLMAAAACATVRPRAAFQSRRPTQANDYLGKLRLGQTETGSFVLTVLSPVPPELASGPLTLPGLPPSEPFERRVTRLLAAALETTRLAADAAAATGNLDGFRTAIRQGVSANLCEAVADMAPDGVGGALDFRFSWAVSRPVVEQHPTAVRFPTDMLPVIREAGRLLRAAAPPEEAEVFGYVVKLERGLDEDRGTVTVVTELDDQLRHVRFELGGDDYRRATEAHAAEQPVTCRGILAKEGHTFVLRNPHGVAVEFEPLEP